MVLILIVRNFQTNLILINIVTGIQNMYTWGLAGCKSFADKTTCLITSAENDYDDTDINYIPVLIDNCRRYRDDAGCGWCNVGYTTSDDNTSCL